MNPHILMVIDHQLNPEKYTQEQLEDNYKAAYRTAYRAADADAADANAAAADAAAEYAADVYGADNWINRYFNVTGENKQDYIAKINKDKKRQGTSMDTVIKPLKTKAKEWINANVFDGDDRSDTVGFNAPEFYELINDLIEYLEEQS